ncbi:vitellogenin-like [Trichoplusia ni]|uniref:Vitellogenin-like n=1 Tax=Trichoplusia ni TaxID=7111 RepID=A0A7E5VS10_TRINI|nr:vitellogenin-like [Trichoplusia ni]
MKLLVLTAIVAAVVASPLSETKSWPWQVGKEYTYDVDTYTWSRFEQSGSNGNAFVSQFIVRVLAPGRLVAKLQNPQYAQMKEGKISLQSAPAGLEFKAVPNVDQPFEILVDGGRILSVSVPSTVSASSENVLKGLLSGLQVDLSTYGHVHNFPNSYDKESFQGLFKKNEADVTGDCETLYSVSPVAAEWRRVLPDFAEDPIEITKSRNYGSCKKLVAFGLGVPEGNEDFIKHTSESRIFAGKQGTIYKSETLSTVVAKPLVFGKQNAEVFSYVGLSLESVKEIPSEEWKISEEVRKIDSLLFTEKEDLGIEFNAQNVAKVQALLQELAPLLQEPNKLPSSDFLAKFESLVYLTNSLNSEQLALLTSSFEDAKSSDNAAKKNLWVLYRDAIAQTGTIAAFKEVKSWILNKKIEGEEAAEVIASLAGSLHTPSEELFTEFFLLSTNPVVVEQKYLNVSAILAASKFIRLANADLFVVDKIIPLASKDLKQAIADGDYSKADAYIRVLGNLAHPEILNVFAPYLDGSVPVNTYLRTQIVISLKTLAHEKNDQVRAVLFSILKNTAESYEVRVAAALNIFLSFPTADMFRIMAHMTNNDPSTQVRAVLVSGITYTAGLKDPRFAELVKNANSVKSLVAKEKYGARYSTDSIIDTYSSEDNLGYLRELAYIGSGNSALPKYQRTALRLRGNGWTEENWATLSVSDMQDLFEYIMDVVAASGPQKVAADLKFSPEEITKVLDIKRKARQPLQASLFIDNLNQQRLFTFTERELGEFLASLLRGAESLIRGSENSYVKVIFDRRVYVTFPVAAGVPFIYSYSEPTAFIIQNQASFKFGFGGGRVLKNDFKFTYARNLDGKVGFVDTIGDVFAYSGVVNKLQFNVPLKASFNAKKETYHLNFELPEEDVNLIHLSVTPYTDFRYKSNSWLASSENPSTQIIERAEKVFSADENLGQLFGVALRLQGYSYSADYKNPSWNLFDGDIVANVQELLYQKDIALTEFNLNYVAKESKNKAVSFTVFLESLYNQKVSGDLGPASVTADVAANSAARREQFAKRVSSGIESANVQLVDFSVAFDGQEKVDFVFTGAYANSFVDNKSQGIVFLRGTEQLNAVFKMTKPKIVPLNFEEALKNPIKSTYEADIKFANDDNIKIVGTGERSEEYTQKLRNSPLAKQCLEDSSNGNLYQKDCYNVIIQAHAPDFFKSVVTYKNVSPAFLNLTYETYKTLKELYSWEEDEDFVNTIQDGTIEIESQAFYFDKYFNYKFTSKYGVLKLDNIEGMYYYPYAMAFYAPISNWERSRNWFTDEQTLPFCAVDGSKVKTYSGRSYEYSLTSSWHVVMVDDKAGLTVLARRPSANQEEVYIAYKTNFGKYVELDIKPTGVEVKSNVDKKSEGVLTSYFDSDKEVPILEYYTLAEGVQIFNINEGAFRVVYDKQRLIIFTADHRSSTNGLCGQSTSQIGDDYLTPFGLVDQPAYYGAAFSLDGESSDAKTAELKKQAKLKAYQSVTKYTNILRSDAEWSKIGNESVKGL